MLLLAAFLGDALVAGALGVLILKGQDDPALVTAYGAFCWLGGVLWQRLVEDAENAPEDL